MYALGRALTVRLRSSSKNATILLGMDTRESGPEIARALVAGIQAEEGEATLIGVVPTPAVAYLCRTSDAAAAISISASHNAYHDNGVKIFGHDGMKLADALEAAIESELMAIRERGDELPRIGAIELQENPAFIARYERFLLDSIAPKALRGKRVAIDPGHGAAYRIAPEVFRRSGADVKLINDQPNGININEQSGALHPERLSKFVVESKADFGVAFDGDADRAIFVDEAGRIRNGDEILYLWAKRLNRDKALLKHTVVATVMSNFGFERQLNAEGIRLIRTQVGDKYVLEKMLESGAVLGGEQSGHIIDLRIHTTGDGIHTALVMGEILATESTPFSLLRTFKATPQVLVNQPVASKPPLETLPSFVAALRVAERRLGTHGRVLVRYSGTENLVRVMVEGDDPREIASIAEGLRATLTSAIGG